MFGRIDFAANDVDDAFLDAMHEARRSSNRANGDRPTNLTAARRKYALL
jgi:hypothetical protein